MKKAITIFILSCLLCALLSTFLAAFALTVDSFTLERDYAVENGLKWAYSGLYDTWYVEYQAEGTSTWIAVNSSLKDSICNYPSYLSGKLRVKLTFENSIVAVSSSLNVSAPFYLVMDADGLLSWNPVDNAVYYTIESLNILNNTWSTVIPRLSGSYTSVYDERLFGKTIRIKCETYDGWFCYSNYFSTPFIYEITGSASGLAPWESGTKLPVLDIYPEQSINFSEVKASTGYLFSGLTNSRLFPYAAAALGILLSFAVVSYFAFRMH